MSITIPGSEYTGPKSPAEEVTIREIKARKEAKERALQSVVDGEIEYKSWKVEAAPQGFPIKTLKHIQILDGDRVVSDYWERSF
jgi:hypothetical protein